MITPCWESSRVADMERWTIVFGEQGCISHLWRQCPNKTQLNMFLFFKIWVAPLTLRWFEGEPKNSDRIGNHFIRQITTFGDRWPRCDLDLFFSCFSYSSFRRSCLWCFSVFISAISSKWRNNIKSSWVMCCFLWRIALKLPCSPATQLVVTPGAWWLEDVSGCRMAQKTTRGFAPISKVLYAFVLNLFEYNGIINTSYTHTFTSCWSTIIFAKAQTHTHTWFGQQIVLSSASKHLSMDKHCNPSEACTRFLLTDGSCWTGWNIECEFVHIRHL